MSMAENRQALRLLIVGLVYEMCDGNPQTDVKIEEVQRRAEASQTEFDSAVSYLKSKDLLHQEMLGSMGITSLGIDEVEALQRNPRTGTEHLPAPSSINVIQVQSMYGSQIQQAASNSHQRQIFDLDFSNPAAQDQLRDLLAAFRDQLSRSDAPVEVRAEAAAELHTIETQLDSPRPKPDIIRSSLNTLWNLAQNISGGVVAQALMAHFELFGIGT